MTHHFIQELESRFNKRLPGIIPLEGLIPAKLQKYSIQEIVKVGIIYESEIKMSEGQFKAEILQWKKDGKEKQTFLQLQWKPFPSAMTFSLQYILCLLYLPLFVSTATAKRSFSTIKRLKTYLWSTMLEERLNGLALLNIHKDIDIDNNKVIDRFVTIKPRRMQLKDWSNIND
ncbi:hypothetical protein NQ314_009622 [Rhamnusium bicolor]|uniref:HAT C-terminal dimerisation domain-containing protein n=1 Tax=Rhamnusium bicolor TaxID=1586634 RepID=A0AAV8XYS4_9CUCU|nr:hypothetical protein NQ314_009622 [Rhamnusium bicolor]